MKGKYTSGRKKTILSAGQTIVQLFVEKIWESGSVHKKKALSQSHDQEKVRGVTVKKKKLIRVFQSFEGITPGKFRKWFTGTGYDMKSPHAADIPGEE
jgi:hypothetical protein